MTGNKEHDEGVATVAAASGSDTTEGQSSDDLAKREQARGKLATSFAQVTTALMATPRYQKLSITDLEWVVLEPLLRDRIAIVSAKQGKTGQPGGVVGIAIWARTSDAVNKKIEQQIRAALTAASTSASWSLKYLS